MVDFVNSFRCRATQRDVCFFLTTVHAFGLNLDHRAGHCTASSDQFVLCSFREIKYVCTDCSSMECNCSGRCRNVYNIVVIDAVL